MKIQRILFPTDFSDYNNSALEYASVLAADADALLYIVHVDELHELNAAMGEAGYLMAAAVSQEGRPEVRERLENVLPTTNGIAFAHHYLTGSPVTEIIELAEAEHIDLIVMASHGRTGLPRLLMGSIAEGLMRKAPCPVLIVRQPAATRKQVHENVLSVSQY
jgi:nucleotide-binding universal stress UspA family protein